MAGVVIGVETDEITIQDPKQDLTTDGKNPDEHGSSVDLRALGVVE